MRYIVDITEEQKKALILLGIFIENNIPFSIGDVVYDRTGDSYIEIYVTNIDHVNCELSGTVIKSVKYTSALGDSIRAYALHFKKILKNEQT